MRRLISSGSPFEAAAGYSRAVVDGEFVFVAGTTGFDYALMTIPTTRPSRPARPCATSKRRSPKPARASAMSCGSRYYLPEAADWPRIGPVLGEVFGAIRPAATALICGLIDPRMKIEIEVTARRADAVTE